MNGTREFLIHLFTITIGLLIALGLEGAVEWQHHRHLVHQAEQSLRAEIENNAKGMPDTLADLHKEQEALKHDVAVLKAFTKTNKFPKDGHIEINFNIRDFQDVSWKTAQNTGALAYMPYEVAQEYSTLYADQSALGVSEQQAARDTVVSLGPFINMNDSGPDSTVPQVEAIQHQIETLQGQLLLVESFMNSLNKDYKQFLASHNGK